MNTDEDLEWTCQYCGVQNSVWIDLTIDRKQEFFEDCRICCRPNRILILIDAEDMYLLKLNAAKNKIKKAPL